MGVAWPIPHAFQHFAWALTFLLLVIINTLIYIFSDTTNTTFNIMMFIVIGITLLGCIITGISLKRNKIVYEDENHSSSTIKN